jgi:ribonuclease BN (tRNA processing enzyme)
MMMKFIVLGSGTCVPSLKRNAPGYYLESGGTGVLLDCGSGTLLQLEKSGRSYRDIDAVCITHLHPDHFADLMPLIHALRATPGFTRKKDLTIIGPEGLGRYYDLSIASIMGHPKEFTIEIQEMEDSLVLEPFVITSMMTVHSERSLAYRFEEKGSTIVYTGDAAYDEGLIDISRGADLLVIDSSFPESMKVKNHLTSRECGLVAERAGVRKLLLSHLYPVDVSDEERLNECRKVYKGDVSLAEDLMEIDINIPAC